MPSQIVFALDNKEILQQTYDLLLSHSKKSLFDLEEERVFSHLIDHSFLQMSFSFRSLFRARQLANLLIDRQGELDQKILEKTIDFLENKGFICYPNGYSDSVITEHQLIILKQFTSQKIIKLLYRFSPPVCHKAAENLLFDSLGISAGKPHTSDIRRGVLCASLTPLRQNIGSCFATAPGILVQKEQLALFLVDLYQLLSTGQLKRTHNGNEYIAILNTTYTSIYCKQSLHERALLSPGILQALKVCGVIDQKRSLEKQIQQMQNICSLLLSSCSTVTDLLQKVLEKSTNQPVQKMQSAFTGLTENALLKAWEFTLASFSEADPQLIRWHLYTALGFSPEESEGLGSVIYSCLQEKLEIYHQEIGILQKEIEVTADQLRAVQGVLHRADATSRIRSFQAEYQSLSHHLQSCIDRRDQLISEANDLNSLFSMIVQYYLDQFSSYFQEVYDPQLVSISDEDASAGFRLFYKHGRTDASLWTAIETEKEFNQFLRDFFLATESLLFIQAKEQKVITEMVAAIVLHLHQNAFFLNVQKRMKSKEPWCYISGGTMKTLVQNYFCTDKVTLEQRVVESPLELLIFLLDTLKEMPPAHLTQTLLMNSPVHAFLLLTSEPLFKQGWQDNGFTYTWVRDAFIHPGVQFYQQMLLSPQMQQYLLQQISSDKINYPLQTPKEFREQTLDAFPKIAPDDIDAFLYQQLPLTPAANCKKDLQKLLSSVLNPKMQEIIEQFSLPKAAFISAAQMKKIAKSCLLLAQNSIGFSFDIHSFITHAAYKIGLSPRCLIFADTNWSGFYFGFVINPGTQDLELWRFDASQSMGFPMSSWKKWLESENKPWIVYVKPSEYRFPLHSYGM
ncbi:hypothetical protein RHABOEDO_000075 [Candidatus Rhabdochlamydia oedothoracis]|uniref:Uncharacterized protein n=1 Tax=Candidatus Rhabdochlamydia oedothoracis TaxID=2720720 RepID=A0ABX8V353_9BACT|nr:MULTISPECIES: hypothetical protein [Rhabdochlamydia]KAG6558659.1 hypothetical protein RHOW815_001349 [Candidatus Rhabdochlamydia sp. W815]QYF47997.1 hypothetical protein RHABOEDO_000075 [Candidatus Rhabdochlamydia oedothoracis]